VTRRRRAAVLLGLALLLGVLAASDMAGRERALRAQLAPVVGVVAARAPVAAGRPVPASALAVRRVPLRYAPRTAYRSPEDVAGRRAAVAIAAGTDLDPALLAQVDVAAPALRRGERALDVVALAPGGRLVPGARVDVVATADAGGGRAGATRLVLRDAEVLSAGAAPAGADAGGLPRVRASLRVTTGQAVDLAGVLADALQVRLLARP
jgi:pilus assembly protein CpaB